MVVFVWVEKNKKSSIHKEGRKTNGSAVPPTFGILLCRTFSDTENISYPCNGGSPSAPTRTVGRFSAAAQEGTSLYRRLRPFPVMPDTPCKPHPEQLLSSVIALCNICTYYMPDVRACQCKKCYVFISAFSYSYGRYILHETGIE